MAYQSVHSGPAIDAAVTQLADIQIVRDESNANLATVQNLAAQVATDAGTASTAAASATQTLNDATAAIAAADHARQEQIDAEIAIVADQRFAAEQAATEAVAAAAAAVVTVTQDMAARVPTPNKLPLADAEGKIASDWLGADIARAADVVLRQELAAPDGAALVGGLIASNLTINVPADQPTINAAFNWLRGRTIARGAIVTIKVADGTHTLTQSINGNHPQGVQVRLIGNETTPSLCVVRGPSPATFDALVVSNGHTLGYVNGLKFDLASKSEWPNNTTGILANNGARIICGPKVEVNNWYYGIAARNGSFISCRYAKVSNAGDVGIWAFVGSTVEADYAESTGAGDAVNPWGFGFQAEFGSAMVCTGATASGCKIGGIAALSNSTVRAYDSIVNANTGSGYVARGSAILDAIGGSTTNNSGYGISVEDGANVRYVQTNTGNAAGIFNAFSFMGAAGGQARVASSSGPLRVDATGASPIYMNTAGGLQFEVLHVASAANRLYAAGAPTGAPSRLGASGSDANIDIALEPKGSGKVRFGTTQAIPGGFANNSIIEIKDAGGATVQIPCKRL